MNVLNMSETVITCFYVFALFLLVHNKGELWFYEKELMN